ncbi:serine carboxypeptidase-like 11 [Bidens hawaiensis]|uniref:serine carboxypeptidase-like 11 n=1 Tax=Bidens hawaiensis TaxID=980011 RepID=UPI00404B9E1F
MMMHWFVIIIFFISFHASNSAGIVIKYLPGFQGPLPFYLETGYVGVDENEDVQLFYYFIRSESDPDHDPLMLWVTGGPGCSSISGLLYEIGPIQFAADRYNGGLPTLILRPDSWTKTASIIFLDVPVGTGFSYARTTLASRSTDIQLGDQANEFMRKWFESHREFASNPFYVGGDSYSGITVPIITQYISDGNEAGNEPYINLKGYVLGNPMTFPEETNYQIQFANGMGLISDELYKSLFHKCHGEYRSEYISTSNTECHQNLEWYQECIRGIEKLHILQPCCATGNPLIKLPTQKLLNEHRPPPSSKCSSDIRICLVYYWLNEANVREALHIRKGGRPTWIRCSLDMNFTRTVYDVRPYHLNLSKKGYRSLIYSGDHDMHVPHQSTQAWIKDLNYSVIDRWRSWKLNGQVVGYTESYSNMMTYASVKARYLNVLISKGAKRVN